MNWEKQKDGLGVQGSDRVLQEAEQLRLGHIDYLNSFPLLWGLRRIGALELVSWRADTPSALNRQLLAGELDVSAVSSIVYARAAETLLLLPDLSISADGPVQSVLLLCREPIRGLEGRALALDAASETSVILTQLVLRERYGVHLQVAESEEPPARLMIGDPALRVWANPGERLVYDLGHEWKALTGRPMVFAVWAVRRDSAQRHPQRLREVVGALHEARALAVAHPEEVATAAAEISGYAPSFLRRYFQCLQHNLSAAHQAGLVEFYRRAQAHGLLHAAPDLCFWSDTLAATR